MEEKIKLEKEEKVNVFDTYGAIFKNGGHIQKAKDATIPDFATRIKIVKLNRWLAPFLEEIAEAEKTIKEKYKPEESFKLSELGEFLAGDIKRYDSYIEELEKFYNSKISPPTISFGEDDFEGSDISASILDSFVDYNLLILK